jgi:X-X-X-Leu-X-X-Gly heptad repeat protein
MYQTGKEKFNVRDIILQLLFVILFIFILIWIFPTKNYVTSYVDGKIDEAVKDSLKDYEFGGGTSSEAFANNLFYDNILRMKEAAISYFTFDRLPTNVGDKVKLTLKQMQEEKLVLSLIDSNGKTCDASESYVQITKEEDEYILKVNLKCSDYEDYLLVHLGCYDYCEKDLCTKKPDVPTPTPKPQPTPTKNYEYEYKQVINGKWGAFGDWSAWQKDVITANDYTNVETKVVSEKTGSEKVKVGIERVQTGTKQIQTGTKQVASGTRQVQVGTQSVQVGTKQVKIGEQLVNAGTRRVAVGTKQVPYTTTEPIVENRTTFKESCDPTCTRVPTTTRVKVGEKTVTKYRTETVYAEEIVYESVPVYSTQPVYENRPVYQTVTDYTNVPVYETVPVYEDKPVYENKDVYANITYYRKQIRSYISGTENYKWSRSNNDTSLLNQGYSLTGNKREV